MADENTVQLAINTIRTLSMDAVQQAKSGHPGTPMALAPLIHTIWNRVLQYDPQDPIWPNRDRSINNRCQRPCQSRDVFLCESQNTFTPPGIGIGG